MGSSGAMGGWMLLWVLLALVLGVTGGVVIARVVHTRHSARLPRVPPAESPAAQQAREALRLRYANGEISREDYLQGKVELED